MYLLDVISEDKTSEITSLIKLNTTYQSLPSTSPAAFTSLITRTALAHHTHRFVNPNYAGLISSTTSEVIPCRSQAHESSIKSTYPPPDRQDFRPTPHLPISQSEVALSLRPQYVRFLPPPPTSPPTRHGYLSMLEEVLGKFWNAEKEMGRDDEWRRSITCGMEGSEKEWVYLLTPFVCCLSRPVAVFLGFQRLMHRLGIFVSLSG